MPKHLLQLLSDGFQLVFGGVSSSQTSNGYVCVSRCLHLAEPCTVFRTGPLGHCEGRWPLAKLG